MGAGRDQSLSLLRRTGTCSIYGRALFVARHKHAFRTGKALASALQRSGDAKRSSSWLDNLVDIARVCTRVGPSGELRQIFLTKSARVKFRWSSPQLAVNVLQNSKMFLARAYALLELLFGDSARPLYTGRSRPGADGERSEFKLRSPDRHGLRAAGARVGRRTGGVRDSVAEPGARQDDSKDSLRLRDRGRRLRQESRTLLLSPA